MLPTLNYGQTTCRQSHANDSDEGQKRLRRAFLLGDFALLVSEGASFVRAETDISMGFPYCATLQRLL